MSREKPRNVAEVLERANAIVAAELVIARAEEAQLHAPVTQQHHGPAEKIDPATETILREHLGS